MENPAFKYPPAERDDIAMLIQFLSFVYPISAALSKEIYNSIVQLKLEKDEILVEEGDFCTYMYFIKKGAMMGYCYHNGKKITTYISVENEFVSSISGLYGRVETKEAIVAIEPSELLAIHTDVLLRLFQSHFDLNFLFRVMVEQYYCDAQERSHIVRVGNVKERYLYFIQTKPGYMERLPLDCVASLLDMKPITLSRIKKQYASLAKKDKDTEDWRLKIEAHLEQHLSYRDKQVSLASLAADLGLSTHKLSALLNNSYHLNFVDFINSYRIREIKEKLSKPGSLQNYTIESIAYDAGFSSRSAFYSSFKKLTYSTPREFLDSLCHDQAVA